MVKTCKSISESANMNMSEPANNNTDRHFIQPDELADAPTEIDCSDPSVCIQLSLHCLREGSELYLNYL